MTTPETTIARYVAAFEPDTLSRDNRHLIRRAILDTIACGVAGRDEPASVLARAHAADLAGGTRGARVWSDSTSLHPELAAWRNGIEAHVLDYDDVASPMRGHPSVAMLPALLALAEQRDLTLAAVEDAYAVGFEVLCRMSSAVAVAHYDKGWHNTATLGTLAGVVAAARLLRLDAPQTRKALGIALTQLAGSRGNFGSMAKSLQAGQAGQVVVRSAQLAAAGFDGAPDALSGPQGFLRLYTDGGSFDGVFDNLGPGAPALAEVGLEVKKYPLCYATHSALDAIFALLAAAPVNFSAITEVEIACSRSAFVPLIHKRPQTGLEAKFSIQYAMAAALLDGHIKLASFSDAAVQRPEIQAFFPRVRVIEAAGEVLPRWAEVRLRLHDGAERIQRVDQLRGGASMPLTDAELLAKVGDCFSYGGSGQVEAVGTLVLGGASTTVRRLIDALRHQDG